MRVEEGVEKGTRGFDKMIQERGSKTAAIKAAAATAAPKTAAAAQRSASQRPSIISSTSTITASATAAFKQSSTYHSIRIMSLVIARGWIYNFTFLEYPTRR